MAASRLNRPGWSFVGFRAALGAIGPVVALYILGANLGGRLLPAAIDTLVGALLVNVVWAAVSVRSTTVKIIRSPTDATVGDRVPVAVRLTGLGGPVELQFRTSTNAAVFLVEAPTTVSLACALPERAVATTLVVRVISHGPLGRIGLARNLVCALPQTLAVGPEPFQPNAVRFPCRPAAIGHSDDIRGTRPYVPGDPMRQVHWPSVARSGTLMVKEFTPPPVGRLTVVVDVGDRPGEQAGEQAASRAAWICSEALRRGFALELATVEGGRTVVAPVRTDLAASRRLAAVVVTPAGDHWGR